LYKGNPRQGSRPGLLPAPGSYILRYGGSPGPGRDNPAPCFAAVALSDARNYRGYSFKDTVHIAIKYSNPLIGGRSFMRSALLVFSMICLLSGTSFAYNVEDGDVYDEDG